MRRDPLRQMLGSVLYLGVIGYGGPAVLAEMKKVFTRRHDWFSEAEFMEALSLAQVLPGATQVSIMGYLGYRKYRFWGGVLFPLLYVTPAVIGVTAISWAYFGYGDLTFVRTLFVGLGALVVALLLNATLELGKTAFAGQASSAWRGATISVLAFLGSYVLKANIVWLIVGSGLLGLALLYSAPRLEPLRPLHPEGEKAEERAAAPPEPRSGGRLRLGLAYLPLFVMAAAVAVVLAFPDARSLFGTFLQIGLLGFGGGFAAVPVIQHVVVDRLHWLDLAQLRDGIAIGQITPGPVFITATFIGYKVAGVAGAVVATCGIFLPSVILMLLLAGVHARVRHLRGVQALIGGFLFAFIGLLASVTLQFGLTSLVSWQTWLIFVAVFVYVWRFDRNVLWAILATVAFSILAIGH